MAETKTKPRCVKCSQIETKKGKNKIWGQIIYLISSSALI